MQDVHTHTDRISGSMPGEANSQAQNHQSTLIDPVPLSIPSILVNPRAKVNPTTASSQNHARQSSSTPRYSLKQQPLGKRKLIRQSNSRFASNPHAVRPRRSDYFPSHTSSEREYRNIYDSKTPLVRSVRIEDAPRDAGEVREWTREWRAVNAAPKRKDLTTTTKTTTAALNGLSLSGSNEVSDDTPGMFNMSLSEARTFLKRRAGVISRKDPHSSRVDVESSPLQDLVDAVEDEFDDWKSKVVYRDQKGGVGNKVIVGPADQTASSSANTPRITQQTYLPHTLVYEIDDSFDRLVVHSLARIWGLRSFSKDSTGHHRRLTHILKPPEKRPHPRAGIVNPLIRHLAGGPNGNTSRHQPPPVSSTTRITSRPGLGGLDTPPTTDVGSELDSASEFETWTEESAAETDTESERGVGEDDEDDEDAVSLNRSSDAHATVAHAHDSDVEAGGLGDVEEESEGASELAGDDERSDLGDETLR